MDISYLLDHNQILQGEEHPIYLLLLLETWPEEKGKERKPLNLGLVLDRSGSMEGEKLASTKEAAQMLVHKLQPRDTVSVVAYDSKVQVLLPPTSASQKRQICRKIDQIEPRGCTNLSAGWIRGLTLISERASSQSVNRVLLLTDGLANEGVTDLEGLTEIGRQFKEKKVTTTTLGFGTDFNEEHLLEIAGASGGRFFYIEGPESAPNVFMSEFGDLVKVIGQNLRIAFRSQSPLPPPQICGEIPHQMAQNSLILELGDLLEEDRRQILTRLDLPPQLPEGKREIVQIEVTYDSVRGEIGPRAHFLGVDLEVLAGGEEISPSNPEVEREIVLYRVGEAKISSARLEEGGDFVGAARVLENAAHLLEEKAHLAPEQFPRERQELLELARKLLSQKINRSTFRKTLRSSTYSQTVQLGSYKKRPSVYVDKFALSPDSPERILDLREKFRSVLESFGHESTFVDKAEFIFRELVDNAIEHGCKGRPEAIVEGEIRISKHYFKCLIKDRGPGFDYRGVLKEQNEEKGKPPRGLSAIESMGALLHFNREGNAVTATLSSQGFLLQREVQPLLKDGCIGEIALLKIKGNLDNMTHYRLKDEVHQIVSEGTVHIVVNMEKVSYISSSGIGTLINSSELCRKENGRFILTGMRQNIKKIIDLLGMTSFFESTETVEEALQLLS